MTARAEPNCQDRILDAAETVFADVGYSGASVREIVRRAGVNLATVYYYFGSKSGLMEAVLKRRFGPLRQEHLEALRAFERAAPGRPLPVEKILEAMLLPPLRLMEAPAAKRQAITRLLGRIATEPDAQTQKILRSQRTEVRQAFLDALQTSLPQIPRAALQWRMEFVWGALTFILCNPRTIEVETHGACDPVDANRVLSEMLGFFSAGFRAAPIRPTRRMSSTAPKPKSRGKPNACPPAL